MPNFLERIDIYRQQFYFTYRGKRNFTTKFGGILSIVTFIIIIIVSITLGTDMYLRKNPHVIFTSKEEKYPNTIRLNDKTMRMGFMLSDWVEEIDDERFLQIVPLLYVQIKNKKGKIIFKEYVLDIEKCKNKKKGDSKYRKNCLKDYDLFLAGSWAEENIIYLELKVMKCSQNPYEPEFDLPDDSDIEEIENYIKNLNFYQRSHYLKKEDYGNLNLLDQLKIFEKKYEEKKQKKIKCLSEKEINTHFEDKYLFFNIEYDKVNKNPKKFKDAFTFSSNYEYYEINKRFKKTIRYYFDVFVTETDLGIIFQEKEDDNYSIGINSSEEDYNHIERNENELMNIKFYTTANIQKYSRKYLKLQTVFANLGGFLSSILLIFNLIVYPYIIKKMNLRIINSLYHFEDNIDKDNFNIEFDIFKENFNRKNSLKSSRNPLNNENSNFELKKNENIIINENHENVIKKEDNFDSQRDKELINYYINNSFKENKMKMKFSNIEIAKSSYFFNCCNKDLKKKSQNYKNALNYIKHGTDFLAMINLCKEFKILKHLLLNNIQQKCLDYTKNLKIDKIGFGYDDGDFPEMVRSNMDESEALKIIKNYFSLRKDLNKMTKVDQKIYNLIDRDIVFLMDKI